MLSSFVAVLSLLLGCSYTLPLAFTNSKKYEVALKVVCAMSSDTLRVTSLANVHSTDLPLVTW